MLGNKGTIPLSQISPYRGSNTNSKLQFPFIVRTSKSVFRCVETHIYLGSSCIFRRKVSKFSSLRILGYKKAISPLITLSTYSNQGAKIFYHFFVQTVLLSPFYRVEYFQRKNTSGKQIPADSKQKQHQGPMCFIKIKIPKQEESIMSVKILFRYEFLVHGKTLKRRNVAQPI